MQLGKNLPRMQTNIICHRETSCGDMPKLYRKPFIGFPIHGMYYINAINVFALDAC